ncbi:DNA topoisomerase III [Streptococcus porcinus]|uniref:type IA DNA topoisomerase n=1 Tax=Streptococcus porcinus TaxID=1340 RepID=UPI0010CACAB0|nr:DNA topoisomerase [Streptococcus porcinus]VTS39333.1 DNA topoisomerase III [Streptococcus porcinus]
MLTVILAEKDQQAQDYAEALGQYVCKDKVFIVEHTDYFEGSVHIVASEGHLFEYEAPQDNWSLDRLPLLDVSFKQHLKEDKKSKEYFNRIYKEVIKCDRIVIGTDSDREGERIAYSILSHIPNAKNKITNRLWVSSLSKKGLEQAFKNLRDPQETYDYYLEAEARAQSDWLVGMNLSPYTTLELQRQGKLPRKKGNTLSVGRVQTSIVRLICENDIAISNFEPSLFYKFKLEDQDTNIIFSNNDKIQNSEEALKKSRAFHRISIVTSVEKAIKRRSSPKLFNLAQIQSFASSRWKFSAEKTLNLIEGLYLKKYVTYPRTDCNYITEHEFNYLKDNLARYQHTINCHFSPYYLEPRDNYVDGEIVAKSSHYALVPTETIPNLLSLSSDERLIYEAITRRTLLMFAEDCSYHLTTVTLNNNGLDFKAAGRQMIKKGWTELSNQPLKKDIILPDYKVDDEVTSRITIEEGQTQAPKRITEDQLIGTILPKYGLGTSATRAEMLNIIQKREYVIKDKKTSQFTPTSKAYLLIDFLYDNDFSNPETTAGWELFLTQIGEGKINPKEFVDAIKEKLQSQMNLKKNGEISD